MGIEYIHYGSKKFDVKRFSPIKNIPEFTKPAGGLWASRKNAKYGWKEWNEDEEFMLCLKENSFCFSLEDAQILEIHSVEDLVLLPVQESKAAFVTGKHVIDFEELLRQGIDAVEVFVSDDQNLYWELYGWDCDSIIVMNPDKIVERREEVRYTEYHGGKAVIRDKSKLSQAMAKLAKLEDLAVRKIPQQCCELYCKYPDQCKSQEEMDQICGTCKMAELFNLLVDEEN